jgi:hypothetical protein
MGVPVGLWLARSLCAQPFYQTNPESLRHGRL